MKITKTILAVCLMAMTTAVSAQKTYVHITTESGIKYDIASDAITSMTIDTNAPVTGSTNGHDWVMIGGVKWATMNVGATTVAGLPSTCYGDYYAWGETTTKNDYSWSTYRYCNGSETSLTKYCNKSSYGYNGYTDSRAVLESSDDAATANWGGKWRMPTSAEWADLYNKNNFTWTWTTQDGHNGYTVTSKKNGNSIFLPAAGCRTGTSTSSAGSNGNYWSSSISESMSYNAAHRGFSNSSVGDYLGPRYYGRSVRPVAKK